jgi:glutamate-5-semialdehyde dehydrogenase
MISAVKSHSSLVEEIAGEARQAVRPLAALSGEVKDRALRRMAGALRRSAAEIYAANALDVEAGQRSGLSATMLRRLRIESSGIEEMAHVLELVADEPDPIGRMEDMIRRPDGLEVARMRVPLGVIAMIYESRPTATVDAVALCLKSSNALVLRGGAEALRSNLAIEACLLEASRESGVPPGAFRLIPRSDHEDVHKLLGLSGLIDLLVPRGGAELIRRVERDARMPVLRHGTGCCHIFVDASAKIEDAANVVFNGKVHNPSLCNATEAVLVHREVAARFWQACGPRLRSAGVEVRGDEATCALLPWAVPATARDWGTEYLALTLAARTVASFEDALDHIERYGTQHTESIMTGDLHHARRFLREVDASAVIVNGSTRLNEGFSFGLGTQLGISTCKLHAYGPMGLRELTTTKFVATGEGHLRA